MIATTSSGYNETTSITASSSPITAYTMQLEAYLCMEEAKEKRAERDENPYVIPLSHNPIKGSFRQSRGSYKGISKSAKGKFNKLNKKQR